MRVGMGMIWAVATAACLAAGGARADVPAFTSEGVWRNPKGTVHVELKPCNAQVCGYVVWATAKAQADARKAGTANLVGSQLLRDFKVGADNVGRGKVFVPDLRATFGGTAVRLDANRMRVRGCLLGNLGCKSQVWTRIDVQPG